MGVAPAIDLTPEQRRTVLALLSRHLPNTTVWVYGSRAKWTSQPGSDLDLVAFANPAQSPRIAELQEAFDESYLPFPVDLFVWDDVPKDFRKRIEAEHVVLTKKVVATCKGWPTVTLGDCIEVNDATYTSKDDWPFVNYLDTANITENRVGQIQHLVAGRDQVPSRARRKVQSGDIVYSMVRPNQRHYGLLKKVPANLLASTGFAVFRAKEDRAHTGFLYWLLTQDSVVDQLHTVAEHSASAYPSIRPADIEHLGIDLPPISEQRAIARILDALDDKIELSRCMARTLERTVRTLFGSWFADSDNGQEGTLGDIALLNPESWRTDTQPDKVAYVDLSNTKWGSIERVGTYAWHDAPTRARRVLRPGDTIVGTVRPANGSYALVGVAGLTGSTGFAVLRPKEDFDAPFVWCAATSKSNIRRLAQLADGGAYPAVSPETVAATKVTVADIAVRRRFSALATPLVDRLLAAYGEAQNVAKQRDMLLPKLISGEIRVQEADDLTEAAT